MSLWNNHKLFFYAFICFIHHQILSFPLVFFIALCQYIDMVCIYCGSETCVTNSRLQKRANHIWRRRRCSKCKTVFSTIEKTDYSLSFIVEKNNGRLEAFIPEKIFVSIYKSIDHMANNQEKAKFLTDTVVSKLLSTPLNSKISSYIIGQIVADTLKNYNMAAFIKYKSYQENISAKRDINRLTKS
jgi:transcriptional regulator NrdR family protein